jgi:hypothetical protein
MAERRKALQQALAAIGVIASLVFVGVEIRQNTRAVQSTTAQAISDQAFAFNQMLAQDDDWIRIYSFLLAGGTRAELSSEDQYRHRAFLSAGLRVMENRFRQVQLGVIDASELEVGGGTRNTEWYRSDHWLDFWKDTDQASRWSPDFVDFMETEVLGLR